MPINLFNNPLSSIKLGADNILKGYIGNSQIFPNDTEITAAAFTNASIANTGGNTPYVVSGEVGASFTLTGSTGATAPSGTQVISTSPTTYQIAIADQSTTCGALARNSQVLITPQGNTVLASGLSNTDTITQAAGPVTVPNNIGLTMSVSNAVYNTVTVGSQVRWAQGAAWNITVNYTQGTYATAVESLRVWVQGVQPSPNLTSNFNFTNISPSSPSNCGAFSCTGTPATASQIYWGNGSIPTGTYSVLATLNSSSANLTTQAMTFTLGVINGSSPTCVSNSPNGLINTQFP